MRSTRSLTTVKSFGEIAAEDDDIRRYFVQTPVFQDLMSNSKQVVLGRKGSGKTALYLALVDRAGQQGYFAYGLTFRDYPWALHSKYAYEEGTQYERFLPSWRFLELSRSLLKFAERDGTASYPQFTAVEGVLT